jgi:hypothetical protein
MGWFGRPRAIAVTLVDDATGKPFGAYDSPVDDLPESFEIATTLQISGQDWSLVSAEPTTRAAYSRTGKLTLRLRRLQNIDPRTVLFSLPTLYDRLPGLESGRVAGDECVLHEDDWRQLELVSRGSEEVDAEMAAIRRIFEQEREGAAFRNLHVRKGPERPILADLPLAELRRRFSVQGAIRGLAFRETPSPVAAGFSFRTSDGLVLYGVAPNGKITSLGVLRGGQPSAVAQSADLLVPLACAFDLELVDWCRCRRAAGTDAMFRHVLAGTDPATARG